MSSRFVRFLFVHVKHRQTRVTISEGYREPSARQEESNLIECPSFCQDCAQLQCCKISNCLLTFHFSSVANQNTQPFISFQRCATHLKIARWLAYMVEHLGTAPRCRTVRFGFKYGRNFSMPHACLVVLFLTRVTTTIGTGLNSAFSSFFPDT